MLSNTEFLHHPSNFKKMKIRNSGRTHPPRLLRSPQKSHGNRFARNSTWRSDPEARKRSRSMFEKFRPARDVDSSASVRQRPYLVGLIMPACPHLQRPGLAVHIGGAETSAIRLIRQIPLQTIVPTFRSRTATCLHFRPAARILKAKPSGLERALGGNSPGFHGSTSTATH